MYKIPQAVKASTTWDSLPLADYSSYPVCSMFAPTTISIPKLRQSYIAPLLILINVTAQYQVPIAQRSVSSAVPPSHTPILLYPILSLSSLYLSLSQLQTPSGLDHSLRIQTQLQGPQRHPLPSTPLPAQSSHKSTPGVALIIEKAKPMLHVSSTTPQFPNGGLGSEMPLCIFVACLIVGWRWHWLTGHRGGTGFVLCGGSRSFFGICLL
ncbi:hypothetical protein ACMFMF_000470 [Clarireedia jacksonii]